MKRWKTIACMVVLSAMASFAAASHGDHWWCDIPFFGKFLPGCKVKAASSDPRFSFPPSIALCYAEGEECWWD